MNTDFRITIGFFQHPKTKKLKRRHGAEGVLALVKLWEFTAIHRPQGSLYEMDKDDILDAVGYPGDTEFVDSLEQLGFINKVGHWYEVNDWLKHNQWAAGAEKRSEKARRAAEKRWATRFRNGGSQDDE